MVPLDDVTGRNPISVPGFAETTPDPERKTGCPEAPAMNICVSGDVGLRQKQKRRHLAPEYGLRVQFFARIPIL